MATLVQVEASLDSSPTKCPRLMSTCLKDTARPKTVIQWHKISFEPLFSRGKTVHGIA